MGICRDTLQHRLKDPEQFKLKELRILKEYLKITDDEILGEKL